MHHRGGAGGLRPEHPGQAVDIATGQRLVVAAPVRRDIAAVADGQTHPLRCVPEVFDDLPGRGLLPLEPVRIEVVDQRDRMLVAHQPHHPQRVVERAVDLDDRGAGDLRLSQLALRDLAAGNDHDAADTRARRVGGSGGGGVAGGRADHRLHAVLLGGRERGGHAAVLERTRRVEPLVLEIEVDAQTIAEPGSVDQRRRPLADRDDAGLVKGGQTIPIAPDQAQGAVARRHAP